MIKKTRRIQDTKKLLGMLPTIKVPAPEYVYLATTNARCNKYELFIKPGDEVKLCQQIGIRHAAFFDQPIHSTVSGTYVGLEKHYHRSGKKVDFLKIKNNFKDEFDSSVKERTEEEIAALTQDDFVEITKNCASVGLGGSSFPTYIKLQTKDKINTILLNGVECEPYITADQRLMEEQMEALIGGIKLLQQCFQCHDVKICIKGIHADLIKTYQMFLKRYEGSGISVCPVKNFYPQGWEIAMIKTATGIDVPSGTLPSKLGIADFNVSTVVGIYQNVHYNRPIYERLVSVTGDGVAHPSNFRVRLGTPITTLLDLCGGFKNPETEKVFILGGPMMGASEPSIDCIISKTVTSCLVFDHKEYQEEPCIRCGSCALSCPVGLEPVRIMNAMKGMPVDKEKVKALNPLKCIECGLCTYSCTSKIRVTDYVRRAKVIARLP